MALIPPRPESAFLMDGLVELIPNAVSQGDALTALAEMSLGAPLASRNNDLGFGFAPLDPTTPAQAHQVVLGPGISRQAGVLSIAQPLTTVLDIVPLLGGASLSDVYAFGAVYLTSTTFQNQPVSVLTNVLLNGGPSGSGQPLFMCRDISLDDALDLHASGLSGTMVPPASGALELLRWVASVNTFNPSNLTAVDMEVLVIDERRPRGWGGFMDETMASYLVPACVTGSVAGAAIQTNLTNAVYSIVNAWIRLPSWSPDFIGYWRNYAPFAIPTGLNAYLISSLGIAI